MESSISVCRRRLSLIIGFLAKHWFILSVSSDKTILRNEIGAAFILLFVDDVRVNFETNLPAIILTHVC